MWPFLDNPQYSTGGTTPAKPTPLGGFWNLFGLGMPPPVYSTSGQPTPTPTPAPTSPIIKAVEIVSPQFDPDPIAGAIANGGKPSTETPKSHASLVSSPGSLATAKGDAAVIEAPPGMTRYRLWLSPAVPGANDSGPPTSFPVGIDEPFSGKVPETNAVRVTPTWARLAHPPLAFGASMALVYVEFDS
jgi:hypothetical protein